MRQANHLPWPGFPDQCRSSHPWGPGTVSVSWQPCGCPAAKAARGGYAVRGSPNCAEVWQRPMHQPVRLPGIPGHHQPGNGRRLPACGQALARATGPSACHAACRPIHAHAAFSPPQVLAHPVGRQSPCPPFAADGALGDGRDRATSRAASMRFQPPRVPAPDAPEQPALDVRNQPDSHRPRRTERRLGGRYP